MVLPETAMAEFAVVISWYVDHLEAIVWFAVVQDPLAQLCAVSHIIKYCVPDLVMVHDHTVPLAVHGEVREDPVSQL
jgi:hypothetical protein